MDVYSESMESSYQRGSTPNPDVEQSPLKKRPRVAVYRRRHVKYQRHSKPPYTYLGMTVVAIQSAPNQSLTLGGIQTALAEMFPFFQGEYRGWRDSIRHNLSFNACFVKTSNKSKAKNYSGCFWTVDLSLVPVEGFKRARVSREMESKWAPTLTEQLQIPCIILPPPRTPPAKVLKRRQLDIAAKSTSPVVDGCKQLTQNLSLNYMEAQYTRYLREQTPEDTPVPLSEYPQFASLLYDTANSSYATAADNLHSLCRPLQYGTPVQECRSSDMTQGTPYQLPVLDCISTVKASCTSAKSGHVRGTTSAEISPPSDDHLKHLLSSWGAIPDSLFNLSVDLGPSTSGKQQRKETRRQKTFVDVNQRSRVSRQTESVPHFAHPYFNTSFTSSDSSHGDVDVKPRFSEFSPLSMTSESIETFVPPALPSECSTISYVSENSQLSTSSRVAFPFTDFSTVSFQDESSLSDIFS